jgi:hypothetical protein
MSRSAGWAIYPWFRMADTIARWSVRAGKQRRYEQSRRRASDQQYGRRASDVTSPPAFGTLHIHWFPVLIFLGVIAGLMWACGVVGR